jgi:photosystem II stability/assembly factor-like uncharacterized protein
LICLGGAQPQAAAAPAAPEAQPQATRCAQRAAALSERAAVVLNDIAAASKTRACAVGNGGVVLSTGNGGATWARRTSGTLADLKDVAFPTKSRVWAVGVRNKRTASGVKQYGIIIASRDGGKHWSTQRSNIPGGLFAVSFSDGLHGWAAGVAGVYRTTNGGLLWKVVSRMGGLAPLDFTSAKRGWACAASDGLFRTVDAGRHWSFVGAWAPEMYAVSFAGAKSGWAVGGPHSEGDPLNVAIMHTADGGSSWADQNTGVVSSGVLMDVTAASSSVAWAVGTGAAACQIVYTVDGGTTWKQQSAKAGYLTDVCSASELVAWAVGGGRIVHTVDGGAKWVRQR